MARGHTRNRHTIAYQCCSKISTTEIRRCVTHGRYATCSVHENSLRTTNECVFSSDLFVVAVVRWRLKLNKVKIDKACVRFYSSSRGRFGKCILCFELAIVCRMYVFIDRVDSQVPLIVNTTQ